MVIDVNSDPMDILLAGVINFDDRLNEALVGKENLGKSIGECKILVYSSEGPIPHFHIENKSKNFDCYIKIYSNEYFDHGHHTDKLTKSQAIELNEYLKSHDKSITDPTWSIWNTIVLFWNGSNPDCKFPDSKKVKTQPDYTKLS